MGVGSVVLATVAVFVTYSRISAGELYNVSGTGLEGVAATVLVAVFVFRLGRVRGPGRRI